MDRFGFSNAIFPRVWAARAAEQRDWRRLDRFGGSDAMFRAFGQLRKQSKGTVTPFAQVWWLLPGGWGSDG